MDLRLLHYSPADKPYHLPETAPSVPKRPVQQKLPSPSPPPQIVGQKRPAPEDDAPDSKRVKMDGEAVLVHDSDDDIEIL
jgi:hypothetical protein